MKRSLLVSLSILAAACAPEEEAQVSEHTQPTSVNEEKPVSDCPDDGPRLALTNICAGRAHAYMNAVGETPALPDQCQWSVQETEMPAGEVLLYRAANCGDATSKLEFAGGARSAELHLVQSGLTGDALEPTDWPMVRIIGVMDDDLTGNILLFARDAMEDQTQAQDCVVKFTEWEAEAVIVDVQNPEPSPDGPRAACGPYGLDQDNRSFWRVQQGFSWFFDLGQDAYLDIDPGSLTLMTPASDGGWNVVD